MRYLLPLLLLIPVSAFADSFTVEFFTTEGPKPIASNFEYDPVQGRFLTPILVTWDIVPTFELTHFTAPFFLPPFVIEGCQGYTTDRQWFSLLTGQCGAMRFNFFLAPEIWQTGFRYVTWYSASTETQMVGYKEARFQSPDGTFHDLHSTGTILASPAVQAVPMPEGSSASLLLAGLLAGVGLTRFYPIRRYRRTRTR